MVARAVHVLHVVHSFPPDSFGGVETYVRRLAQWQRDSGMQVTVLAGSDVRGAQSSIDETHWDGLRVLRLPTPPRLLRNAVIDDDLAAGPFVELLRREAVDLVHVHHWHNVSGNVVAMAHEIGVPAVVTLHDHFWSCARFFRVREQRLCGADVPATTCAACIADVVQPQPRAETVAQVARLLQHRAEVFRRELELAAACLVLSQDQRAFLMPFAALENLELDVLPLPAPELTPQRTWHPTGDGRLRIVTWGGLVEGKGLHLLIDACESLPAPSRLEVHHYGRVLDSVYAGRVQAAARRCALVLHGAYDARAMTHELPRYDVAVFPSLFRETHGYAVDEAMLLGLPVVVPDQGAPAERIDGRGRTFRAGDSGALAALIDRLASCPAELAAMRAARPAPAVGLAEHGVALQRYYAAARAMARAGSKKTS